MMEVLNVADLIQTRCSNSFSLCATLSQKRPSHVNQFPTCLHTSRLYATLQYVAYIHHRPIWQKGLTFSSAFNIGQLIPFLEHGIEALASSRINIGSRNENDSCFVNGRSYVCRALGKIKSSQPDPDENESEPLEEANASNLPENSAGGTKKDGISPMGSLESLTSTDWRAFRARLIAIEQQHVSVTEEAGTAMEGHIKSSTDDRWAHPILTPEPGCVLIATEKLDGLPIFERTVILLLNDGLNGLSDGPFGLILNRPLPHTVKDMRPNDLSLNEAFGNNQVHFGGPLISDLILLLHGKDQLTNYQEVIPGVYFSPAEGLASAINLVREKRFHAEEVRFFFGYAGWALNQLKEEIENGYWHIAACSSEFFMLPTNTSLWEEILCIMGGKYAELSRKSRK